MIRIIDEQAYYVKSSDRFKVKAYDLGNGHLEISARREFELEELDWEPWQYKEYYRCLELKKAEEEESGERRELLREKSARRAKGNVRRLCKVGGLDTLLTLTYRANMTDLDVCKANLKEFVRRLRRYWPEFVGVAAFEQQKRGAWHVHLATRAVPKELVHKLGVKVKSFNMIRGIWRSVVGADNGNIDVARRKRTSQKSAAKIAAYLSKYILKAFREGVDHVNRWTKFGDVKVPKPIQIGYTNNMMGIVEMAYSFGAGGDTVSSFISRFGDAMFFAFENLDEKKPAYDPGGLMR